MQLQEVVGRIDAVGVLREPADHGLDEEREGKRRPRGRGARSAASPPERPAAAPRARSACAGCGGRPRYEAPPGRDARRGLRPGAPTRPSSPRPRPRAAARPRRGSPPGRRTRAGRGRSPTKATLYRCSRPAARIALRSRSCGARTRMSFMGCASPRAGMLAVGAPTTLSGARRPHRRGRGACSGHPSCWRPGGGSRPASSPTAFKEVEDRAVDEALALQEEAGLDVVTDGEMRRLSFQSQVPAAVDGFGAWDLDAFLWGEWHSDELGDLTVERPPIAVVGPAPAATVALGEEFAYARGRTDRVLKVTLPSPSLFANFYDPERSRRGLSHARRLPRRRRRDPQGGGGGAGRARGHLHPARRPALPAAPRRGLPGVLRAEGGRRSAGSTSAATSTTS